MSGGEHYPGEVTFYGCADGTWTVLGYDSIEDWLEQRGEAAVVVVPVEQLQGRSLLGGAPLTDEQWRSYLDGIPIGGR